MNRTTFKATLLLQLHIPWVGLTKILNCRADAEEIHMSKLNDAKQEQMFQDAGHTKKYESERGHHEGVESTKS